MRIKFWLALVLTAALVFMSVPAEGITEGIVEGTAEGSLEANVDDKKNTDCISPEMVQLKIDMQKVWIDHTIWTRSYIVSAMSNRPDQKDVLERLLRNQQDIGNVFKPYYGDAFGDQLADLLKEHIQIAGKIIEAVKADN